MKSLFQYIVILFFIVLNYGCSEEIGLDTELESRVFIFGTLTNSVDFVSVNVLRTVDLQNTGTNPINNATVSLFTKNQNGEISLITNSFNVSNGRYQSDQMIAPIIGNYYWIEVELSDGVKFTSDPELLKTPVPIENITIVDAIPRVHFKDPKNERNFYALEVSFFSNQDFLFENLELSTDVLFDGNPDAFIESSDYSGNRLEARLFNLNFNSYRFYSSIVRQNEEVNDGDSEGGDPGQLFASPPANLTGNITNNTTNKIALGNFGVISTSSQMISF